MTNKFNYMKCGGFDYFENTKILNNKEIKFHTLDISGWITSHKGERLVSLHGELRQLQDRRRNRDEHGGWA